MRRRRVSGDRGGNGGRDVATLEPVVLQQPLSLDKGRCVAAQAGYGSRLHSNRVGGAVFCSLFSTRGAELCKGRGRVSVRGPCGGIHTHRGSRRRQGAAVRRGAAAAAGGQRHQRVTCMHTWMFTREEWPVVGMAGSVEGGRGRHLRGRLPREGVRHRAVSDFFPLLGHGGAGWGGVAEGGGGGRVRRCDAETSAMALHRLGQLGLGDLVK